tara:strand:+ start:1693 stop:2457 length:765 start_codon:yes stop_codon:yes gene_type:complete
MAFPSYVELGFGEQHDTSATATGNLALGTLGVTPDGNVYRYCKASGTGIAAGLFCTTITTPTHESTVTVAHAVGTEALTVTAGSIAADDFKDGYLVVSAGTGAGEIHRIKSNTATSGGTITVTLYEGDGLKTAWSTSDTDVDLFVNPYSALVICPVDGQQLAVALTQGTITASYYFWGLVKGLGAFKVDAPAAAGLELDEKNIVQSLNHAGQGYIDGAPDATAVLAGYRQNLGFLLTEEDATDNEMEFAKIDLA